MRAVRVWRLSLSMMLARWRSTVLTLMPSPSPMSLLRRPSAMSLKTSLSLSVRPS